MLIIYKIIYFIIYNKIKLINFKMMNENEEDLSKTMYIKIVLAGIKHIKLFFIFIL